MWVPVPGHIPWQLGRKLAGEGIQCRLEVEVLQDGPEHLPVQSEVLVIKTVPGQEVRSCIFSCRNPVRSQERDVPSHGLIPEQQCLLRKNVTSGASLASYVSWGSSVVKM